MSCSLRSSRALVFIVCLCALLPGAVSAGDHQWQTAGRVIAISDIHGARDEFVRLLDGLNLIDAEGHWRAGIDHLVIVGDVLDRGVASRDVLAMIMRLEGEAEAAGGRVHMLLGNHEIMNLVGDLRYVAPGEYARYLDVEDAADRERELQRYRQRLQAKPVEEASLLADFDKLHPPGFFGHRKYFAADGVFGQWLLGRPVLIRVNDSVFVHGGLSPAISGDGLDKVNSLHRQVLGDYVASLAYFIDAGVLPAASNHYDHPALIKQQLEVLAAQGPLPVAHEQAANKLLSAHRSAVFQDDSPTWYRGNVGCSSAIERARLRLQLDQLGATRLVIGHTPTSSRTVEGRFDNMLIRIDTGMLKARYQGQPSAAVIEDGKISAYYAEHPQHKDISVQARRVGPRPGNLSDSELETLLSSASVQNRAVSNGDSNTFLIEYDGRPIEALFTAAQSYKRSGAFIPEVAAYRLDRHLGLEMVPVTVVSNIDGNSGAITLKLDNLMDEDQRMARQLGASAWCSLKDQFNMMYLFDILLHNEGRERHDMRYLDYDLGLILTGNGNTLGTRRKVPRYLAAVPVALPADLRSLLQALDEATLQSMLGDVLDVKRRKALLARRDLLLQQAD